MNEIPYPNTECALFKCPLPTIVARYQRALDLEGAALLNAQNADNAPEATVYFQEAKKRRDESRIPERLLEDFDTARPDMRLCDTCTLRLFPQ